MNRRRHETAQHELWKWALVGAVLLVLLHVAATYGPSLVVFLGGSGAGAR